MARKKKEDSLVSEESVDNSTITFTLSDELVKKIEDFESRLVKLEAMEVPAQVKIKLDAGVKMPIRATEGSSGYDIFPNIRLPIWLASGECKTISTGLYFQIPKGMEIQVRPRSGWASKYAVTVVNTPGTIDQDYRGELKVILINHGSSRVLIDKDTKIAQIVFCKIEHPQLEQVLELDETDRGSGGFGSTGGIK